MRLIAVFLVALSIVGCAGHGAPAGAPAPARTTGFVRLRSNQAHAYHTVRCPPPTASQATASGDAR
jgi:hypothetical protein